MRRTVITCDHCGAELDEMRDYDGIDIIICSPIPSNTADLCHKCFTELIDLVEKYLHPTEGETKKSSDLTRTMNAARTDPERVRTATSVQTH